MESYGVQVLGISLCLKVEPGTDTVHAMNG